MVYLNGSFKIISFDEIQPQNLMGNHHLHPIYKSASGRQFIQNGTDLFEVRK